MKQIAQDVFRETLAAMKSGDAVVLQVERAGRLLYLGLELE